jgi:hypothetical protein
MFGTRTKGDDRVRKALDSEEIKYEVDKEGDFKVVFDIGEGRSQVAFVNSNTETFHGIEIREVWSVGLVGDGQLSAEVANSLLARNATYKLGGWEIVQQAGKVLAIFKVCVSASATPDELRSILQTVSLVADQIEKEYLHSDDL